MTPQRHMKHPGRGPWDWRLYLPHDEAELNDLRVKAAIANPAGVHLGRFLRWVEAEMNGDKPVVSPQGRHVSKYRRFLYELRVDDVGPAEGPEHEGGEPSPADNDRCAGSVKLLAPAA